MINVGGKVFRTLADEMFVNGMKVYKAYVGDVLVYPEDDGNIYKITRVFEYEGIFGGPHAYLYIYAKNKEAMDAPDGQFDGSYHPDIERDDYDPDNPHKSFLYHCYTSYVDGFEHRHNIEYECNVTLRFKITEVITTNFPLRIVRDGDIFYGAPDSRILYANEYVNYDYELHNYSKNKNDYIVIDKVNDCNNSITIDTTIECAPIDSEFHFVHDVNPMFEHHFNDPVIDYNSDYVLDSLEFTDHFILSCNFDKIPLSRNRKFFNFDNIEYFSDKWKVEIVDTDGVNYDLGSLIHYDIVNPYQYKDSMIVRGIAYEDTGTKHTYAYTVNEEYSNDYYGTDYIKYIGTVDYNDDNLDNKNYYYEFPTIIIYRSKNNSLYSGEDTSFRRIQIGKAQCNRLKIAPSGMQNEWYLLADDPFYFRDFNRHIPAEINIEIGQLQNFCLYYSIECYAALNFTTLDGYNGSFIIKMSPIGNGASLNNYDGILDFISNRDGNFESVNGWDMRHDIYKSVTKGYGLNYIYKHDEYSTNISEADFINNSRFYSIVPSDIPNSVNVNIVKYTQLIPEIIYDE